MLARSKRKNNLKTVLLLLISAVSAFQSTKTLRLHHSSIRRPNLEKKQSSNEFLRKEPTPSALSMSAFSITSIATPLASLGVLATVVLVHEAGHYLAAKSFKIKVEEFSVGVGPKLLGFNMFEDEFSLRLIPLGGYVRFPENYNSTLAYEREDEYQQQRLERKRNNRNGQILETDDSNNQPTTASYNNGRLALLSTITFGLIGTNKEKEEQQKKTEEMSRREIDMKEKSRSWWKQLLKFNDKGNRSVPQNPVPLVRPEIDYYQDPDLLQNRSWQQRAVVLSGGIIFNFLLAFTCYFGEITGGGLPKPNFESGAVVTSVKSSGASANILQTGDIITSINGKNLLSTMEKNAQGKSSSSITISESQQSITDVISVIRQTKNGDSIKLTIERNNKLKDITVKPQQILDNLGNPTNQQTIGVMLGPNFQGTAKIQSKSIGEATKLSLQATSDITRETTKGLAMAVKQIINPASSTGQGQMSGPIGLIKAGSSVVSTKDAAAILTFMAAISVNLAVINAVPLPALDGGQLIFVLSEAITGKKIDQRKQEAITSITLLFLLGLSITTAFDDVKNIF